MERVRPKLTPTPNRAFYLLSLLAALYEWYHNPPGPPEPWERHHEPPYIASAGLGLSIISQIRALIWNDRMLQKGYEEHSEGIFKMPWLGTWVTVVSGKYIDEVVRAPESSLSFQESLNDTLQIEYLFGTHLSRDQVHIPLIRNLNRNLDPVYLEIANEAPFALEQELGKGIIKDDWVSVKSMDFAYYLVLRLNLRSFIGIPLCRDSKWIKAMDKDAVDLGLRRAIIKAFPKSKRGDASIYLSRFGGAFQASNKGLTEIVNEALAMPEEERPNNLLSWILSSIPAHEPDVQLVSTIFQLINLVAQNTITATLCHALFHLVANPHCIDALREEIQLATNDGDMTRDALEQMPKLDSFIRETQRLSNILNRSMTRIAMQDFIFSDGTRVPAGEAIQVIATPIHHDPKHYPDPLVFNPWRFSDLAEAERDRGSKAHHAAARYDMVTPSRTFLPWGLGKHACPGRWYAAMVIKHLLAYIILHYEIKLPDSAQGKRPPDLLINGVRVPNRSARLLFKLRSAL